MSSPENDDEDDIGKNCGFLRVLLNSICDDNGQSTRFFISGVICNELQPSRIGSLSDVFKGIYNGQIVALKQLRTIPVMDTQKWMKV